MSDVTQTRLDSKLNSIITSLSLIPTTKHDCYELVKHVQYAQTDFVETATDNIHPSQAAIEREAFTIPGNTKGAFLELFITAIGDTRATVYANKNSILNVALIDLDPLAVVTAGTNNNDFGTVEKPPILASDAANIGFGALNTEWIGTTAVGNGMANMQLDVTSKQPIYLVYGSEFDPATTLLGRHLIAPSSALWTGDSVQEKDNYFAKLVPDVNTRTIVQKVAPAGHSLGLMLSWGTTDVLSAHPTFVFHARVFGIF